jgi:hypothetical protein
MDIDINVYCSTCFAVPGELCRTKYIVHGYQEVTAVICPTHNSRLVDRALSRLISDNYFSLPGELIVTDHGESTFQRLLKATESAQ